MTGIVRQLSPRSNPEPLVPRPSECTVAGGVALIVRETRRDPQGLSARVSGHVLVDQRVQIDRAVVSLVQMDESGDRRVASVQAQAEIEHLSGSPETRRLDFSLELRRRLTPPFETQAGVRWWDLRVDVDGDDAESVVHRLDVPTVRRTIMVGGSRLRSFDSTDWFWAIPAWARPGGYALRHTAKANGQVVVKSRGDWGVVEVPRDDARRWVATIVGYELVQRPGRSGGSEVSTSIITRRNLVAGPNTVEFEVPSGIPPTHRGPMFSTWYELRVHTADERRLGARHDAVVVF